MFIKKRALKNFKIHAGKIPMLKFTSRKPQVLMPASLLNRDCNTAASHLAQRVSQNQFAFLVIQEEQLQFYQH